MDGTTKKKREINPRQNASLISIVLFLFTFKTIRKGARSELKEDDIYEILNDYRSEKLGDDLEKLWKKELLKPKPSLFRAIFTMIRVDYFLLWVTVTSIEIVEILLRPKFMGKVVSYFEPNSTITRNQALLYGMGLLLFNFVYTFYSPTFVMILKQMCMRIRISCSSLLYRKCLKLDLSTSPQFTSGTMVTLITKDLNQFEIALDIAQMMVNGTFYMIIMTVIMYNEIGIAAIAGTSLLFILVPIQTYLGKKAAQLRLKTLQTTDKRVKITHEVLTAIRIIKMYTWELFFSKSVKDIRRTEIKNLKCLYYVKSFVLSLGQLSSRLAFYVCVMTYVSLGNHITAEKAFVVVGCFGVLQGFLAFIMPEGIVYIAEMRASLGRITKFLLLEEIASNKNHDRQPSKITDTPIWLNDVTVASDQNTAVLQDINVDLKKGLTAIAGHVGAGKSTFLKVVLGDTKPAKGSVHVSGKISYASQEPWLFPGTIRQNIIFGERFEQNRYNKIVEICALTKDILSFPKRDLTCLTDKGLNLSRGQKTRINLARAIYRDVDIYLLDDCLSAVDSNVGNHIFYECIKKFLCDKTCLLVTHQTDFFKEVDDILILSEGCVEFQGTYKALKDNNDDLRLKMYKRQISHQVQYENDIKENSFMGETVSKYDESSLLLNNGNEADNMYSEHNEEGAVKKEVYFQLIKQGGGIIVGLMVVAVAILSQVADSWSEYFVSFWVDTEQDMSGFRFNQTTDSAKYKELEESHAFIMKQYSMVIVAASILTFLKTFSYVLYFCRVSNNLHTTILDKILNAKMYFFDQNLSGNIINRFSRDLGIIDEDMPQTVFSFLNLVLILCGIIFVVSSVNLYFIIPSIVFAISLHLARRYYVPTGRSIRRLEGATRSPVIGHLNATFEGLTTIRASEAQTILEKEFDQHQNHYNSVAYINVAVNRAFGLYLTLISSIYISVVLLTFLLIKTDSQAGQIGLAISQSFGLTGALKWVFRQWTELEIQMTSAERVLEYTKVETENKNGTAPKNWPCNGKIIYENVNLKYSPTSEKVLKDVTFEIEAKNKIGIVGRTGAGKSSIISSLFRMYDFEGKILIDDVDITSLEIPLLRSNISMIPQDPVLFFGTIRSNLDPKEDFNDKDIWAALEEVEMKNLIENLNSPITEGGANYSIGQRQLLCLARAIVHKNAILILDEATANIDPETDILIQRAIKRKFSDCTIITVAHRLNTIMDSDKVLVMDSGMAVEYDRPEELLNNKNGLFYKMVKEAGLL